MRAAVITFPGSNCDDDCSYALERVCEFKVDKLWHKDEPDLSGYDLVVLPGGFSYGDYLRCGAMAAQSPIMQKVKEYAATGKLVLGICNGFQILCESALLPGALAPNATKKFVCSDVDLKVTAKAAAWTGLLQEKETLRIPIAHGDGRYIIEEADYQAMKSRGQIVLSYEKNPNGSSFDIAGVCNEAGNVFGLMPHPERASDLRTQDGMKIFKSVITYLKEKG